LFVFGLGGGGEAEEGFDRVRKKKNEEKGEIEKKCFCAQTGETKANEKALWERRKEEVIRADPADKDDGKAWAALKRGGGEKKGGALSAAMTAAKDSRQC